MAKTVIKSIPEPTDKNLTIGESSFYASMSHHEQYVGCAPYYSPHHDRDLEKLLANNSWLASAHGNVVKSLYGIDFTFRPIDSSVGTHVALAKAHQELFDEFLITSGESLIHNLLLYCNGAFIELLDAPEFADTPSVEERKGFGGYKLWHSTDVVRKSDPEFPYAVRSGGKLYKVHHTRMINITDSPSSAPALLGVGRSAVSRAVDFIAGLSDLRETLSQAYGDAAPEEVWVLKTSFPERGILDKVEAVFEEKIASTENTRTSKRLKLELEANDSFEIKPTRVLPQSFDFAETVLQFERGLASAYGVDLRRIWDKDGSAFGGSGDSEVTSNQTKEKLFGWFTKTIVKTLSYYVLPPTITVTADGLDDQQDEQRSRIEKSESETASGRLTSGLTNIRVERLIMLQNGRITQQQFEELELSDGRLPNGDSVTTLFYSTDKGLLQYLQLAGIDDPLDVDANASEEMVTKLGALSRLAMADQMRLLGTVQTKDARLAHAALKALQAVYMDALSGGVESRPEQEVETPDTTKSFADRKKKYRDKLFSIFLLIGLGSIEKEEGESRILKLAFSMIVFTYLFGRKDKKSKEVVKQAEKIIDSPIDKKVIAPTAQSKIDIAYSSVNDLSTVVKPAELQTLSEIKTIHSESAKGVADWIEQTSKELRDMGLSSGEVSDELAQKITSRTKLWERKIGEYEELSKVANFEDELYQWIYDPAKEHCNDCIEMNGKVKTGAEWLQQRRETGIFPKSDALECRGYYCGCRLAKVG